MEITQLRHISICICRVFVYDYTLQRLACFITTLNIIADEIKRGFSLPLCHISKYNKYRLFLGTYTFFRANMINAN